MFPKNISLTVTRNGHKAVYESVDYYINYSPSKDDAFTEEQKIELQKCIELDELWEIQWYPITPIGFYYVFASSFEKCLELANRS